MSPDVADVDDASAVAVIVEMKTRCERVAGLDLEM